MHGRLLYVLVRDAGPGKLTHLAIRNFPRIADVGNEKPAVVDEVRVEGERQEARLGVAAIHARRQVQPRADFLGGLA